MARGLRLRSVVVAWLRVLLPLAALAILSTLFLLSRHPATEAPALPQAGAAGPGGAISGASYAGVTADGARIVLSADRASPARGGGIDGAEGLRLDWAAPDGLRVGMTAPQARIADRAITLEGGVRLDSSTGWRIETPRLVAATDRSSLSAGPVTATAPFGTLTAGAMSLRRIAPGEGAHAAAGAAPDDSAGDHVLLDFTGGVRLVYRP